MHAGGHRVTVELTDGEQLDDRTHLAGALDVGSRDLGDALAVDVGGGDPGMEGQAGQDRCLGGGVETLDVCGGVRLGVPEVLGLLQRLAEAGTRGVHLVEDEVRGAVDDAEHPGHPVARERLTQRPHDRDRTGDRGLVVEVAAGLLGRLEQRRAVLGQQCLVGADDARAVLQRGQDQRAGGLDAADDLDDEVDVCAARETHRVGGQQSLGYLDLAHGVESAYGDTDQIHPRPDPGSQVVGLVGQQPHHLRPDRTAAEHGHLQRLVTHPLLPLLLASAG